MSYFASQSSGRFTVSMADAPQKERCRHSVYQRLRRTDTCAVLSGPKANDRRVLRTLGHTGHIVCFEHNPVAMASAKALCRADRDVSFHADLEQFETIGRCVDSACLDFCVSAASAIHLTTHVLASPNWQPSYKSLLTLGMAYGRCDRGESRQAILAQPFSDDYALQLSMYVQAELRKVSPHPLALVQVDSYKGKDHFGGNRGANMCYATFLCANKYSKPTHKMWVKRLGKNIERHHHGEDGTSSWSRTVA